MHRKGLVFVKGTHAGNCKKKKKIRRVQLLEQMEADVTLSAYTDLQQHGFQLVSTTALPVARPKK